MSTKKLGGPCVKLGDHINSDVIIPGRYLTSIDPAELATHAFEPLGKEFQERLLKAKVVVAGKNFGCGSAREQAASCLIGAGIEAVVAESFARVFFRNAINTGLVVVQSSEAVAAIEDGDDVEVDVGSGQIHVNGRSFSFPSYPKSLTHIVEAGGLMPYVAQKLEREAAQR
ncbi:MAG: 3-isopropylmalate dehydratase small subunit [Nevskiaceae bacterium]|jgi:3-isopropylmalate/(R)-2-methylmalate dehydratase small subunit|nr:3-isopropylmalate dehydratase small subunit [Nevskiaceae bacterium]